MTETDTLSRLQSIFRDILDAPNLTIGRHSHAGSVPGWDSLAHINLVYTIEQEFGVRFALGELQDLKNVGDLIDLLEKKTARK
jgi:acyl carrier protein